MVEEIKKILKSVYHEGRVMADTCPNEEFLDRVACQIRDLIPQWGEGEILKILRDPLEDYGSYFDADYLPKLAHRIAQLIPQGDSEGLLKPEEIEALDFSYEGEFKTSREVDRWVKKVVAKAQDAKTASLIRAERLDRPELAKEFIREMVIGFGFIYGHKSVKKMVDKVAEKILALYPDVDKVAEMINKIREAHNNVSDDKNFRRAIVSMFLTHAEWQALKAKYGDNPLP